jgi:hypothetical protein
MKASSRANLGGWPAYPLQGRGAQEGQCEYRGAGQIGAGLVNVARFLWKNEKTSLISAQRQVLGLKVVVPSGFGLRGESIRHLFPKKSYVPFHPTNSIFSFPVGFHDPSMYTIAFDTPLLPH